MGAPRNDIVNLFLLPTTLQAGLACEKEWSWQHLTTRHHRISLIAENLIAASRIQEPPLRNCCADIYITIGILPEERLVSSLAAVFIQHQGEQEFREIGVDLAKNIVALTCALLRQRTLREAMGLAMVVDIRNLLAIFVLSIETLGHGIMVNDRAYGFS